MVKHMTYKRSVPEFIEDSLEWLIPLTVLAIAVGIAFAAACTGARVEGEGRGIVTATECGGIIWVTCRAYIKTSDESSQEDEYCVQSREVLRDLNAARDSGRAATVRFERERVFVPPWLCAFEPASIVEVKL